jgi:hypothetical protein
MTYSIFDAGNLVVSCDDAEEAHEALDRLAREDGAAAERLVLVVFDEHGQPVDDAVPSAPAAHRV